jgi:tetratricopeptide (TPR) repeat protein
MIGARRRVWRGARSLCRVTALTLFCSLPVANAKPSVWDVAREPALGRAERLLSLAERSRIPAEDTLDDVAMFLPSGTSEELNRQLNARAAALITIADGHQLGDSRLLYLLGDALVQADKSYLPEGRLRLEQALALDPDSPLAGEAWFSLAVAEGKLRKHVAERAAYTRALEHEWQPELRATMVTNRAESTMAAGDLRLAIQDYRLALALSRSAMTQALAFWGLAVATERDGDLPSALELARRAGSFRFGPPSHLVVALDLPSVYFTPDYEEHYYRALATMAEADVEEEPDEARLRLQTASLLWSLYLDNAQRDGERWVDNARAHRETCRRRLAKIDAQRADDGGGGSEPGADED